MSTVVHNVINITEEVVGMRSVSFPISNVPQELARGDTFRLSIFDNTGVAKVTHVHWDAPQRKRIIECVASIHLIDYLVAVKDDAERQGFLSAFSRTSQNWI